MSLHAHYLDEMKHIKKVQAHEAYKKAKYMVVAAFRGYEGGNSYDQKALLTNLRGTEKEDKSEVQFRVNQLTDKAKYIIEKTKPTASVYFEPSNYDIDELIIILTVVRSLNEIIEYIEANYRKFERSFTLIFEFGHPPDRPKERKWELEQFVRKNLMEAGYVFDRAIIIGNPDGKHKVLCGWSDIDLQMPMTGLEIRYK